MQMHDDIDHVPAGAESLVPCRLPLFQPPQRDFGGAHATRTYRALAGDPLCNDAQGGCRALCAPARGTAGH